MAGVFHPVVLDAEYRRKPNAYFERTREEKLAQQFLDDEQLMFRRSKLDELGSTDLFRTEYPSTPLEAFLTSGRCFVEDACLRDAEAEIYTPDFRGEFQDGQLYEGSYGPYRVAPPEEDNYVIGVDVAEGLPMATTAALRSLMGMATGGVLARAHRPLCLR